jgi:radical SAM superfamily enzyme YgiQ (UPF0313 family)
MLGVLKVAETVRQAGHDVDVLDLSGAQDLEALTLEHWERRRPAAYGISATMPQMPSAIRIAAALRDVGPRLLLGGAHATMVTAAARRGVARSQAMLDELRTWFDCVVAGDGERAVFDALQPGAPFLVDADQPGGPYFLSQAELAEAPWPARDLIDLPSYHCVVGGLAGTSMIGQLGCPYQCAFCGGRNSPTFRRLRLRPGEDVVAELVHVHERYGYRGFMFLDDELNVNRAFPQLLQRMAQAQEDLAVDWRFSGLLKSELFTAEQAQLMYRAGFRKVLIGFESGDARMLQNIRKQATVEDNTRAVELAHAAGLKVKALISLGHAGESEASILRTRDWLLRVQPDEFDATVITVYPGTPYHDDAAESAPGVWTYTDRRTGDRLHARAIDQKVDTPYYKGVPGNYESFVWTDTLSAEQLVALRDAVEREVRDTLRIPWPTSAAERQYEHSMACHN